MKLPAVPFLKKEKEESHYYLALLLRDEKVSAIIFKEDQGTAHLVHVQDEYFTSLLDSASIEELVQVFDKAISLAEAHIPENEDLSKTIFGVKETWVEEGKIKKQYLSRLKKVCDELGLTPIGFMEFSEAVAHLLQEEEGAPISGVFVEVGLQSVTVALIKGGKISETNTLPLKDGVPETADIILKHFNAYEVLPARVIVLNSGVTKNEREGNDKLKQDFLKHTWSSSIPFLHTPQVTVLPEGFDGRAVLFGAASQMGFSVSKQDLGPLPRGLEKSLAKEKEDKAEDTIDTEDTVIGGTEYTTDFAAEAASIMPLDAPDTEPDAEDEETFGFMRDRDIAHEEENIKNTPEKAVADEFVVHSPTDKIAREEEAEIAQKEKLPLPITSSLILGKIQTLSKKIKPTTLLSALTLPKSLPKNNLLLAIPVVVLLLLGLGIFLYFAHVKTTVAITISPKQVTTTQQITFTTTGATDTGNNTIAAQSVTTDENGSVSTPATGQKITGDKAKGQVTLYNSDTNSKKLGAGTTLTGPNNTTFTLDNDVTVASASGDIFSGIKSGTAQANVTATGIGTASNLPSGSKFSVEGASQVAAKNDNAFSGGTQKQITVVAAADIAKLTSELPDQLKNKGQNDLSQKANGSSIIGGSLNATLSQKQTDKKVGDQASSVTLTGTVTFTALAYQQKELTDFANSLLAKDAENNQEVKQDATKVSLQDVKVSKNAASATAQIQGAVLPKIDTTALKSQIAGKSFTQATNMVKNFPQVQDVTVSLSPHIFFMPQSVSGSTKNITIVEKSE